MNVYPVQYHVDRPGRFSRPQVFIRILAFVAIGMLGLSFGGIFAFAYIALPVYAAVRMSTEGNQEVYRREDGAHVARALHWFAAVSAWFGLVSETLPRDRADEIVQLAIEPTQAPCENAKPLTRLIRGLPSAFALMLAGVFGVFAWMWAALCILVTNRVHVGTFDYLVGVQRWSIRLLAYQASLVDTYPPFSFAEPRAAPTVGEPRTPAEPAGTDGATSLPSRYEALP